MPDSKFDWSAIIGVFYEHFCSLYKIEIFPRSQQCGQAVPKYQSNARFYADRLYVPICRHIAVESNTDYRQNIFDVPEKEAKRLLFDCIICLFIWSRADFLNDSCFQTKCERDE